MEKVLERLKEKGECELYSACLAPWIDGGAWVRIIRTQDDKFRTLFWLAGDSYCDRPTKRTFNLEELEELERYLKKYSFI
jgi:hypothetical protein